MAGRRLERRRLGRRLLVRQQLGRHQLGQQVVDRKRLGRQRLGQQVLDQQELDEQELDRQPLDGIDVGQQELDQQVMDREIMDVVGAPTQLSASDDCSTGGPAAPPVEQARPGVGGVVALTGVTAGIALLVTLTRVAGLSGHGALHVPWWALVAGTALTESYPIHVEHRRETLTITLSTIPLIVGLYGAAPLTV